ncbi:hypothetical protein C2845_PM14G15050 [Panicum miliaceum]|uniref:Uncharacterized protein n=1 Tax=Panicum miliaceum TaxID=4540 RepID=A0A3L6PQB0_PANMI|nr:hypothetical protein C2845_PM14G15050 [Panicum miliaceum]
MKLIDGSRSRHSCWKPQHRMVSPAEGQLDRQNPRAKKIRGLVPLSTQLRRSCDLPNQQVNKWKAICKV